MTSKWTTGCPMLSPSAPASRRLVAASTAETRGPPGTHRSWVREALVEQALGVLQRVGAVQQHHRQGTTPPARHADEAAARVRGVARLQADGATVAGADQRVVAAQEDVPALDRETKLDLTAAHYAGDAPVGHREAREHGEIAGA